MGLDYEPNRLNEMIGIFLLTLRPFLAASNTRGWRDGGGDLLPINQAGCSVRISVDGRRGQVNRAGQSLGEWL